MAKLNIAKLFEDLRPDFRDICRSIMRDGVKDGDALYLALQKEISRHFGSYTDISDSMLVK